MNVEIARDDNLTLVQYQDLKIRCQLRKEELFGATDPGRQMSRTITVDVEPVTEKHTDSNVLGRNGRDTSLHVSRSLMMAAKPPWFVFAPEPVVGRGASEQM